MLGTAMGSCHGGSVDDSWLVDLPPYDCGWQAISSGHPVAGRSSDSLAVTCVCGTADQPQTVTWREGTADEICLATFYTVAGRVE